MSDQVEFNTGTNNLDNEIAGSEMPADPPTTIIVDSLEPFWWAISLTLSIVFTVFVANTWYQKNADYEPNTSQLVSESAARQDIVGKLKSLGLYTPGDLKSIPTGVFIEALSFESPNDVNIAGFVWQTIPFSKVYDPDRISMQPLVPLPSFRFPEAVRDSFSPKLVEERQVENGQWLLWSFSVIIRQNFNYRQYPLDHKTVWLQIAGPFDRNAVLVPGLSDYRSTNPGAEFGLYENLVLGGWEINETFFDYKIIDYDTNFGSQGLVKKQAYPELHFNIVIKRRFFNAFVINVIPIMTLTALMFGILLTITSVEREREKSGFNVTGVVSIIAALFFVVMVSHVSVREQFADEGIVYIEYFFLVAYLLMLCLCVNAFAFAYIKTKWLRKILDYRDNIVAKLVYWPFVTGLLAVFTHLSLNQPGV